MTAMERRCPKCGAPRNRPCRRKDLSLCAHPHAERYDNGRPTRASKGVTGRARQHAPKPLTPKVDRPRYTL
jgi:hypothetical protein